MAESSTNGPAVLHSAVLRGAVRLPDGRSTELPAVRPVPAAGGPDERGHGPGLLRPHPGVRGPVLLGHDRWVANRLGAVGS